MIASMGHRAMTTEMAITLGGQFVSQAAAGLRGSCEIFPQSISLPR
jgi:hypothetical protein